MKSWISLGVFVVLVLGGGTAIGLVTAPGEWYASLQKPPFNPPNWVFGPVWSILYVMVAIAGWRTWRRERGGTAMVAWVVQLVLNVLWSPIFFAAQNPPLALAIIVAMLGSIFLFIAQTWQRDRPSALLFLPYAAWVSFATVLNASIVWLN